MTAPKILIYFTPDVQEKGRIPLSDIKFEASKKLDRGKYEITLKTPSFISGNCTSLKSSIKSTATLTFKNECFGEKTKYVIKVNDYFEIWDDSVEGEEWCYFRGIVKQTSSDEQGMEKRFTINLENAGGWLLGDNAVYYLSQLIIAQGQAPSNFFKPIKTLYGWVDAGGNPTSKGEALRFSLIQTPQQLLETLVNGFANERLKLLKKDFYDNSEAIKSLDYYTGSAINENKLFIANKLSEMEGAIIDILKMFEGRPFSEIFIIERTGKTQVVWRNSRWRDYEEKLCMGNSSGELENLITLYSDPNIQFTGDGLVNTDEGQTTERKYSGILTETVNKTNDTVVNAVFIFPDMFDSRRNVPTSVLAQTAYDSFQAKQILDLNSVIRHGYKPVNIKLPFVPGYMDPVEYDKTPPSKRSEVDDSQTAAIGRLMTEYTAYAVSMYNNIQDSGNGIDTFQNNLHCTIADDFRIVRSQTEEPLYVNVNKITWYFDSSSPRTAIEWDRGFERRRDSGFSPQEFGFA